MLHGGTIIRTVPLVAHRSAGARVFWNVRPRILLVLGNRHV